MDSTTHTTAHNTTRIYMVDDFPTVREIALQATGRPDEWIVVNGFTSNRLIQPGDQLIVTEDRLEPLVRVNWNKIPGMEDHR